MLDRFKALRQPLIALTQQGERRAMLKSFRTVLAMFAKSMRLSKETREADTDEILAVARQFGEETGSWLASTPKACARIQSGAAFDQGFDACDLGVWLAVAARAGLEAIIPARPVLSLH